MESSKIKKFIIRNSLFIILLFVIVLFFKPFLLQGKLPIPADTIVGMYHPWRDIVWDGFTAGVPFKNFLITDPVRQQYPWRKLVVSLVKQNELPLWNSYTHAGSPLLANLQSAAFYPFNVLLLLLPFDIAWGMLIFLQPLLGGIFLYLYLHHLGLKKPACLIGALSFSLSGFFVAWLEWGTLLHVALWLPLILLCIDKILPNKKFSIWSVILGFSLISSFFAGHLQTSFYLILFSLIYLAWRLSQVKRNHRQLIFLFLIPYSLFVILTAIQWFPTLQFIKLSTRGVDQAQFNQPGWFIPWQNLVQFLAPDFFGNPTTLNYWGVFNYAEFIGYIGVIPIIFAFYAVFVRRDRKTLFFSFLFFLFLSFALPIPWAKLPYQLGLPLISTSQPTRLLLMVDFCLAVLAAFGIDHLLSCLNDSNHFNKNRITFLLLIFTLLYGSLWGFVLLAPQVWPDASWLSNLEVSRRNLILPTGILTFFVGLTIVYWLIMRFFKRNKFIIHYSKFMILSGVILLTIFDLLRFSWKFTPFTKEEWIFPTTKTIEFLKQDENIFRFMTTDRRLFAPNFSLPYQLQTVEGYDPLYLTRYAELIAASERGEPNITPPFGFNRIITPQNYESRIMDLLNVKYILSLKEENSPKLVKVFQEGETRVYENKDVFPRAFIVYDYQLARNKQEAIDYLMDDKTDLSQIAILEDSLGELDLVEGENEIIIKDYRENQVDLEVKSEKPGILILTDSYYPGWKVLINDNESPIYRVDYNFRAILLPRGEHRVRFIYSPQSFKIGAVISLIGVIVLGGLVVYEEKNCRRASL